MMEEATIRVFHDLKTDVLAVIDPVATDLEMFRSAVANLFESLAQRLEPPLKRRPSIALRLIAEGEPKAKLVVYPAGYKSHGSFITQCDVHTLELLQ
jgi:hypothetical protein